MLDGFGPHNLALKLENLLTFIGIADRALKQGPLNAIICRLFSHDRSFTKRFVRRTPAMDRKKLYTKEISYFVIRGAEFIELSGLFGVFGLVETWAADTGLVLHLTFGKGFDHVSGQLAYGD